MRGIKEIRRKGLVIRILAVIVILLALFMIPVLLRWADEAKERQVVAETRLCVLAAQVLVDEKYAGGLPDDGVISIDYKEVIRSAEVPGYIKSSSLKISGDGIVTELIYHAASGKECMYNSAPGPGERSYELM